jgi:hypothetical protein
MHTNNAVQITQRITGGQIAAGRYLFCRRNQNREPRLGWRFCRGDKREILLQDVGWSR